MLFNKRLNKKSNENFNKIQSVKRYCFREVLHKEELVGEEAT